MILYIILYVCVCVKRSLIIALPGYAVFPPFTPPTESLLP